MTWQEHAACRHHGELDWVPVYAGRGMTQAERDNLDACRAVCARCPVRGVCLDTAVERRERGIWGGTIDRERSELRGSGRSLLAILEKEAGVGA